MYCYNAHGYVTQGGMTINCRGSTTKSLLACKHGFPVLQHVHACQPSTGVMHEFDINIHGKRKSCF
jgi:hypothetical protein